MSHHFSPCYFSLSLSQYQSHSFPNLSPLQLNKTFYSRSEQSRDSFTFSHSILVPFWWITNLRPLLLAVVSGEITRSVRLQRSDDNRDSISIRNSSGSSNISRPGKLMVYLAKECSFWLAASFAGAELSWENKQTRGKNCVCWEPEENSLQREREKFIPLRGLFVQLVWIFEELQFAILRAKLNFAIIINKEGISSSRSRSRRGGRRRGVGRSGMNRLKFEWISFVERFLTAASSPSCWPDLPVR